MPGLIGYARNGGVSIAYQVVGEGEVDMVYVPDYVSNLVYGWESPYWRTFYERLARSFRLILFDKRGTGLSDRGAHFPALETRIEDMRAVLDAVGSDHAVVFGSHEGGRMAALYAATYANEPFVRLVRDRLPEVAAVAGSNYAEVGFTLGPAAGATRTLAIVSATDNLIKGGAGQAIQNMNLMLGCDERASLEDVGNWP